MVSFAISIFAAAGTTYAQSTKEINTYPFISAIPKYANVGETVLINFGLLNGLVGQTSGWNVTAVITDPDGVVTRIDAMTWSTGTVGKSFVPTKEGDYKMVCTFARVYYDPGTTAQAQMAGWYKASESDPFVMTVTSGEGKQNYPGHNLPTEYWTRPIDSQLREWYSISGSWITTPINRIAEYNDPVLSSHVLWSMPLGDSNGGLAGGQYAYGYQDGDAYEGKFIGSVVIAGILYYTKFPVNTPTQAIVAVDLHTGEKLWERSYSFANARIVTGQILSWDSYNNRGVWSYLWLANGTTMYALDPYSGELIYTMVNVPAGAIYYGANGELLKYVYSNLGTADNPDWHLRQWNSSYVVTFTGDPDMSWGRTVRGQTYNATARGFDIDIPLAAPNNGGLFGNLLYAFPNDKVIFGSSGNVQTSSGNLTLSAVSVKRGSVGNILFKNVVWYTPGSFADMADDYFAQSNWAGISPEVIVFWEKNTRLYYAFSLETGQFLWKTQQAQSYEDAWQGASINPIQTGNYNFGIIAYGKLISASVSGIVYCYDIKTGERLWTYETRDKYTESYLSENWWLEPLIVTNGIIYLGHTEHSTLIPKPRGAPFIALNIADGSVVWSIDGMFRQTHWGGQALIADSIIVTQDTYDQMIYAIGKGPTSVTVTAPNSGVTANSPVMIKGTVMDVSPGTQTDKMKLRFANGVPAVSEDSMNDWMLYVYKQFDRPTDVTGVSVTVAVVGANGSYEEFYTVSDESGQFAVSYTPSEAGEYTVYAFFDGSISYYGQWAQDDMVVAEAASKNSNIVMYGIFAVVIIMLAIMLINLLLKKK